MNNLKKIWDERLPFFLFPIIPILVILYITDSFYYDIASLKKDYNQNIANLNKQKQIITSSIIANRISQAKIQNHNIMIDIKSELKNEYDNPKDIVTDLESKLISDKIYNVFNRVLNRDRENAKIYDVIEPDHVVFISNINGIISIENRVRSYNSIIVYKNWDEIINSKVNKDLTKIAIDDILSMKDKTFIWESDFCTLNKTDLEATYNIHSMSLLEDIINSNDISTFKYFNILIPTYVTIDKSPNDIIIVREINMFNIMEPYMYLMYKYNEMVEGYKYDMSRLIFLKIMSCVIIVATLLVSFFLALFSALEKSKEKR